MSRIDEGSDDQRIREMQEAEYRDRTSREKRTNQERVTKSFQEVMADRGAREAGQRVQAQRAAQETAQQTAKDPKRPDQGAARDRPGKTAPKGGEQLAKQAALSHAMQSSMSRVRKDLG